jgi:hypothetical protein
MGIDNGSYGKNHGIALLATMVRWCFIAAAGSAGRTAKYNKASKSFVKPSDNGLDKHW